MAVGRRLFSLLPTWLIAVLALAPVLLALGLTWSNDPAPPDALMLAQAEVAEGAPADTTRFPLGHDTPTRSLPDDWSTTRQKLDTPVWYRLRFDRPVGAPPESLALFIERACANAVVRVNGELLHQQGSMDDPVSLRCREPVHARLPEALLRPHGNIVDIKVAGRAIQQVGADDRSGWLSPVFVGPAEALATRAQRIAFVRVDAPRIGTFVFILLGVLMLALGRIERRESHLGYFGALLILSGLYLLRHWWQDPPFDHYAMEVLAAAVLPMLTLAAVQFFLRYAGWRSQPIEMALYAQCAIMPASLLLGGPWRVHTLMSSWLVLMAIEVFVAMAIHLWTVWHRYRRQFAFMLMLASVATACLVMLILLQQDRSAPVSEALAHLGLGAVLLTLTLHLMQQFGHELQRSEASRLSTEARIREATLEIERNFTQLAELRVEQVTAQERKRIAGDLHDDLGAKLLTIVHTSDNDRISSLAREALEEMRLSVRGLTGKPVKLVDAIGDWRAEFVSRLSQTGLDADWESPADEELPQTLSARTYVQTTRILREAVNNIIKHAAASRCSVTVALSGGDVQLNIQDNGKGIPVEVDGRLDRGHGMASMKHRAKQLHGQCLVESAPGYGTVIRLTLPLDRQVEPA